MFLTSISEELGSNLGLSIGYPKEISTFTHSLQENIGTVPRLGHYYFLPNPLHFLILSFAIAQ
jgi:hypothetical protein